MVDDGSIMDNLASQFIEERGFKKEDFIGLDVSNSLEMDIGRWLDDRRDVLMDWDEYEWSYKNIVYEEICLRLDIP